MLDILYEDNACIVVNKPAGLFSQAANGIDSVLVQLSHRLDAQRMDGKHTFLRLIHRLDRGTSGCLLLAKNQRAAKQLSAQFAARTVKKTYWAAVESLGGRSSGAELDELNSSQVELNASQGVLVDYIKKIENEPRAEVVDKEEVDARLAELNFKRLDVGIEKEAERGRFFEICLKTGRMHQIRVQFATRGMPVVGDTMYGCQTQPENKFQSDMRLGLHAVCLGFRHPKTAKAITVLAPLPLHWKEHDRISQSWHELQDLWNHLNDESTKHADER